MGCGLSLKAEKGPYRGRVYGMRAAFMGPGGRYGVQMVLMGWERTL